MKRKGEPEEEGSGYSWMDTYGDLVTLLLCFFVLLFSFSSVDAEKWNQIVNAFTGMGGGAEVAAFNVSTVREEPIGGIDSMINYDNRDSDDDAASSEEVDNTSADELYEKIKTYITENDLVGKVSVYKTEDTILIRFNEIALFNSGEAEILPEGMETIRSMAEIISSNLSLIEAVRVEGHTDNVPMHSAEFEDNWDLSTKRATNTLRLILDTGLINAGDIYAAGYAETKPIASNDTAEDRAKNRRVDIILQELQDG